MRAEGLSRGGCGGVGRDAAARPTSGDAARAWSGEGKKEKLHQDPKETSRAEGGPKGEGDGRRASEGCARDDGTESDERSRARASAVARSVSLDARCVSVCVSWRVRWSPSILSLSQGGRAVGATSPPTAAYAPARAAPPGPPPHLVAREDARVRLDLEDLAVLVEVDLQEARCLVRRHLLAAELDRARPVVLKDPPLRVASYRTSQRACEIEPEIEAAGRRQRRQHALPPVTTPSSPAGVARAPAHTPPHARFDSTPELAGDCSSQTLTTNMCTAKDPHRMRSMAGGGGKACKNRARHLWLEDILLSRPGSRLCNGRDRVDERQQACITLRRAHSPLQGPWEASARRRWCRLLLDQKKLSASRA